MATALLPPLGDAGERGGLGMFWGKPTRGQGLNIYQTPHASEVEAKVSKFVDSHGAGPSGAATGMKENVDLNKGEIDQATGKLVRPPLPTLKQLLNSSAVAKLDPNLFDDVDPDSLIKAATSSDSISAALTAPTNPSANYYNVLKALIQAVRKELIPVPSNSSAFAVPGREELGPAFPHSVVAEDPEYFVRRERERKELAFRQGSAMVGMKKAYAATGDNVVYCFDRRPIPKDASTAARKRLPPMQQQQQNAQAASSPGGSGVDGLAAAQARRASRISLMSDGMGGAGTGVGGRRASLSRRASVGGPGRRNSQQPDRGSLAALRKLEDMGLSTELHDPRYRSASALEITGEQGRVSGRTGAGVTVKEALGDAAAGTLAGLRVGTVINPADAKNPPIPGDALTDTLRWTAQAAVAYEHKRARCEHVLHMLSKELAKEAERQTRLRVAAARFAASESRKVDPLGDWESYLQGVQTMSATGGGGEGGGSPGKRNGGREDAVDPHIRAKSLKYPGRTAIGNPLEPGYSGGGASKGKGGLTFKASDLAYERFDVAQDRAEGADSLMRVLEEYRLIPVSVSAAYLRASVAEVDTLYAELLGARAAEKGVALTQEEIEAHVRAMNEAVEEGEDLPADHPDRREAPGAGGRAAAARRAAHRRRLAMPTSPDSAFVKAGGAVPYKSMDDMEEMAKYGPSTATARRRTAAKALEVERRKRAAVLAEGPGRDATGGGVPQEELPSHIDADADPTLLSGLSQYNLRPFNAREAARAAYMAHAVPDHALDSGFSGHARAQNRGAAGKGKHGAGSKAGTSSVDDSASMASSSYLSAAGGSRASRGSNGGRGSKKGGTPARKGNAARLSGMAEDGDDDSQGGIDLAGANGGLQGGSSASSLSDDHEEAGSEGAGVGEGAHTGGHASSGRVQDAGDKAILRPPAYKGRAASQGPGRPKARVLDLRDPAEIAAEGIFGKEVMDSKGFREVAMQLTEWNALGSRPAWQKHMLESHDLVMLRESTALKLDQVKRAPKEPPGGRFSHLLGRYMKSDDLRVQLAASNRARFGPKKSGTPAEQA